ncbi:MAG: GIY-YIG nuclease family protein [Oceanicaulis sp.]
MLASRRNGTLYLGVTTNLARRVWEHRNGIGSAFARKYGVAMLVWYETHEEISVAIARRNWVPACAGTTDGGAARLAKNSTPPPRSMPAIFASVGASQGRRFAPPLRGDRAQLGRP